MPVEITAATFDPGYQRLLTGAHDGTLKVNQILHFSFSLFR